jgi:hypothetical protein
VNKRKLRYLIIFVISIALAVGILGFVEMKKYSYPSESKMNLTPVSDIAETAKYGKPVGGNCYLATTAMLLQRFDSTIEFWRIFVYQGNAVSFSYYFSNGSKEETVVDLLNGSTDVLLTAAGNLGFTPHVRASLFDSDGMGFWAKKVRKLGGDFKTYFLEPPLAEYKQVISSGLPLGTSGSPCHNDYNVIEGYNEKEFFAIIPNPQDVDRTDPKISCSIGDGLTHTVFWFTPDGKKISDQELMLTMKGTVKESLENMARYIKNLKEGATVKEFSQKVYLGRAFGAMYLQEQGYSELAAKYKKSAELLLPLASIYPPDISRNRDKIIFQMEQVFQNETETLPYWEAVN